MKVNASSPSNEKKISLKRAKKSCGPLNMRLEGGQTIEKA